MQKEEILNKYKDEEHLLVSRVLDKIEISSKKLKVESTDFLNLNEQMLVKRLLDRLEIIGIFYGCYEKAERKMLFIIPTKLKNNLGNFKINYEECLTNISCSILKYFNCNYYHNSIKIVSLVSFTGSF